MIDRSLMSPLDVHYFDPPEPEVDLDVILEALPNNLRDVLSLDSITAMLQQSFTELLQDREVADVVPEPEPVLLIDHSPSPDLLVATVQQAAPTSDASKSISVPASALFDILEDFIADQHQLAPITSIAGYLDFKRQFDVLTGLLTAHHLLEPSVRDAYFAEALNLSPSDRFEINAALAASYESNQPYPVALVDTILCQYFQPELKSLLPSPPIYEPDEAGFALRQPPSCPLFDFTMPNRSHTVDADPGSHAEIDYTLDNHIHLGFYAYNEEQLSVHDNQPRAQHFESPFDVPITRPYDAAIPSSAAPPLRSLRQDIAPTVLLDLQPSADMSPTTVPVSSSPEVHRVHCSLEAPDPVYVLAVAEPTVSPQFEASVPTSKPPLRSFESDLAVVEHLTEELPGYRIPPCPFVADALPPETVISIRELSPDRAPIESSATPPPELSPELEIPPSSSPQHVTSPPGLQKLPEVEDTARSAATDGLASLSALFAYGKLRVESLNDPGDTLLLSPPEIPHVAQSIIQSVAKSPPEIVARLAVTPPDQVSVEPFIALPLESQSSSLIPHEPAESASNPTKVAVLSPPEPVFSIASPPVPCLAASLSVPHEPVIYEGIPSNVVAAEATQRVRVKSEHESIVMVVQEEPIRALFRSPTPRSASAFVLYTPATTSTSAALLRASTARFHRRSPHRSGFRTRLCPSPSRLRHNSLCARITLPPRVRVPGSDPPCSATSPRSIDRASLRRPSLVRPRTV